MSGLRTMSSTVCVAALLALAARADDARPNDAVLRSLSGPQRVLEAPSRSLSADANASRLPAQLTLRVVDGQIEVDATAEGATGDGLVFRRGKQSEQWQIGGVAGGGVTRSMGTGLPATDAASIAPAAVSLQQLLGQSAYRGASLLTPGPNTRLLSGKVTVRRQAKDGESLAAEVLQIRQGGRLIVELPLAAGQEALRWDDAVPQDSPLADGLPPGSYSIGEEGQPAQSFVVENAEIRDWVREPVDEFAQRVGEDSLSRVVFEAEHLLSQTDDSGAPLPYLCDALDLIESVEPASDGLAALRRDVLQQLGAPAPADNAAAEPQTGIPAIDHVRRLIARNEWSEAEQELSKLTSDGDARTRSLARQYAAVIQAQNAESFVYAADPIEEQFRALLQDANALTDEDRYRLQTNFANYLTGKVQARTYNYAVQAATQLQLPLMTALSLWREASLQYESAANLAQSLTVSDRAAVAMNQARLYCVLSDFLRTLNAGNDNANQLIAAADQASQRFAQSVLDAREESTQLRGAAAEVLAHTAFRRGDYSAARRFVDEALAAYERSGSLEGIASCQRTLGLLVEVAGNSAEAIDHYQASLQISDLLRRRVGDGNANQSKAGFFARHAYTNDRLIGLLIAAGEPREALRVAEHAKARCFEDVLAAESQSLDADLPTVDDVLDDWPDETVALEYYLGTDHVYVFTIDSNGDVAASLLADANGQPLAAPAFVERVVKYLSSTEARADKLRLEALSGRGFDKEWQNTLHEFYQELVPAAFRAELEAPRQLVIVPHHVLHYFPFAALVTERDEAERGLFELPQPKFLVEQPLAITMAPSLVSYAYLTEVDSIVDEASAVGLSQFPNAPDLPGVTRDVENFQAVFGPHVKRIINQPPITEQMITEAFAAPGVILVGTHGHNVADAPLESFLLCNPSPSDAGAAANGQLTVRELAADHIAAGLIVLSACYSGLADRSPLPGDDLFGINRALLQGGASSVVSGLWDVYDDTAPLLVRSMFEHFAAGEPIARSLADAQRDFIAQRKAKGSRDPWIHPYFWAVYTCTGGGLTRFDAGAK